MDLMVFHLFSKRSIKVKIPAFGGDEKPHA